MATTTRPRELGAFLRERRGRITPADLGLPAGDRRRTPGLRREEVAQLAGVGLTWYTWLEQGRASNVSTQVLESVARVLRLSAAERHHMLVLAGQRPVATPGPPMDVRPEHVAVLQQLLPYPAAIQTECYDLVASNRTYRYLFDDLDERAPDARNCAWLMFTDETWSAALVDRRTVLSDIVGRLRAREPEHRRDPRWIALLQRLRDESEEFTDLWDSYVVTGDATRIRRYASPRAGRLDVHFQSLWLDRRRGERIVVMSPADDVTATRLRALDELVGSAPAWTCRADVPDVVPAGLSM